LRNIGLQSRGEVDRPYRSGSLRNGISQEAVRRIFVSVKAYQESGQRIQRDSERTRRTTRLARTPDGWPVYDLRMDDRPSFRFCFGVATIMVVLTLISLMLLFASAGDMDRAAWFLVNVIIPVACGLGGVGLVLFAINWLNCRDDPRHAKRPPSDP
jgi:hypothetical protein